MKLKRNLNAMKLKRNLNVKYKIKKAPKSLYSKDNISKPEFIKCQKKINNITAIFENTRLQINKLRELNNPVLETKLRRKIFREFEKKITQQNLFLSYQKLQGEKQSATEKFYKIISRDFYNHTTKSFLSSKLEKITTDVHSTFKKNTGTYAKENIREYVERTYYESMYFLQGEILGDSCKVIEKRLSDVPPVIKSGVMNFLTKEYMSGYNQQIKDYLSSRKINSDIVANAYANLAMRISFLEFL